MNGALPFLMIGVLLIAVLIFLLIRSRERHCSLSEPTEAWKTLRDFQVEPFPQDLLERIFGTDDWDYVRAHESKRMQVLFRGERKRLAISWLRRSRDQARTLMRFHKVHAAKAVGLEPVSEMKLAFDYILFQSLCTLLAGLIWLRGPMHTRRLVEFASDFSDRLRGLALAILALEHAASDANNFRPRLTTE